MAPNPRNVRSTPASPGRFSEVVNVVRDLEVPLRIPNCSARPAEPWRASGSLALGLSAGADAGGELVQHRHRGVPAHAGVGDALAVDELRRIAQVLATVHEEALHHHAGDAGLALGELGCDLADDERLPLVVLFAVAVAG